jgi:hypothetical protein
MRVCRLLSAVYRPSVFNIDTVCQQPPPIHAYPYELVCCVDGPETHHLSCLGSKKGASSVFPIIPRKPGLLRQIKLQPGLMSQFSRTHSVLCESQYSPLPPPPSIDGTSWGGGPKESGWPFAANRPSPVRHDPLTE